MRRVIRSLAREAWAYPSLSCLAVGGSLIVLVLGVRLIITAGRADDVILGVAAIAGAFLMCASFLYDASGKAPVGRHPSESRRRYLFKAVLKYGWIVLVFVAAGYSWFVGSR